MIAQIEAEWRETPLTCPACGPDYALYSDGAHRPSCRKCCYAPTDAEVWHALITPTPNEMVAEHYAQMWHTALLRVRQMLAGGRTVGHDHPQAALSAEDYINDVLS